jgi:hypothetical protein
MNQIDRAIDALIPIPALAELKAADEQKLLQLIDWLGRWTQEIDSELRLRHKLPVASNGTHAI